MMKTTRRIGLVVAVLGFMVGVAEQARAGLVVYNNRADFDAAVSGQTMIDFETSLGTDEFHYYGATTGSDFGGVTFTDPHGSGSLFLLKSSYYDTSGTTQYLNLNDNGSTTVTATFTNPNTYAFGADLGSLFNWGMTAQPGDIQVILSTGETIPTTIESDLAFSSKSLTFFGVVSDTAFSSVKFVDPSMGLMIDNFAFESIQPVPEPSTLVLVSTALPMGLGFAWMRRRKARTA
ncbi:PEP-CTERM protein-sorting domain-containing protein [Singulisphaera sp. GP187]|uniref:PEP-CTERM sorting domain-containing protein n=1 Tax=Singulisphaera sp. GP187 TaxID=1882752 RepID=UPI0009270909|nr:PEP-CTERM sorting domain-containing protein [Singulisphaera sp. GP187]SIO58621.1 PEP-CTERM protein-sorting domain-containing protein [Singulisphaera sp. GP187]